MHYNENAGKPWIRQSFFRQCFKITISPKFFTTKVLFYTVFFSKVRISPKVTIACNGFCLLRHTKIWLGRDIISYSGTMFSRVLVCTLLHCKLRDYSLGQMAFVFFKRYLLSHGCFAM